MSGPCSVGSGSHEDVVCVKDVATLAGSRTVAVAQGADCHRAALWEFATVDTLRKTLL